MRANKGGDVEPGSELGPSADVAAQPDADPNAIPLTWRVTAPWIGGFLGALIALLLASGTGVAAFALGQPRTIPTMLAAGLLALASVSAWLLGRGARGDRQGGDRAWLAVATLLALLAVEQATALHHWVAEWFELPRYSILYAGMLVGVTAFALGSWKLRSTPSVALWVAGGGAWLGGQLSEVALGGKWQHEASASLELCGCALLTLALMLALPAESRLWEGKDGKSGMRRLAESAIRAVSLPTATRAVFTVIGVFALLGGLLIILDLEYLAGPVQNASNALQWFDLNQELTFPAYFSGLLLAAMAGLAVFVARSPRSRPGPTWPWLAMALIVAFLAVDEVVDFHGRAQKATDIEAQVLLAPLIIAAAVVGLVLLVRVWPDRRVRWMFLGGTAAWGLAMAIDPSTQPGAVLAFPEEVLEMTGSALFFLALLSLARAGLELEPDSVPSEPRMV